MKRVFAWGLSLSLLGLTGAASAFPQSGHPAMTDPSKAKDTAPAQFRAKFETTKGDVVFECTRDWAPNGVDRFYNLVKIGFFDDVAFFRVVTGFVAQWGIHGDPKVSAVWSDANLPPDPPKQSNTRGMLTYAMAGRPDTRSTQLFVNFGNNANLDKMGFAPICKVVEGMDVADKLYAGYEETVTDKQGQIQAEGNDYLRKTWPELDYIKTGTIVGEALSADRKPKAEGDKPAKTDDGDKIVLGAIALILGGGGALLYLTREKGQPASKPKDAPPPAPADDAEPKKKRDDDEAAAAPKKKKKPKAD